MGISPHSQGCAPTSPLHLSISVPTSPTRRRTLVSPGHSLHVPAAVTSFVPISAVPAAVPCSATPTSACHRDHLQVGVGTRCSSPRGPRETSEPEVLQERAPLSQNKAKMPHKNTIISL